MRDERTQRLADFDLRASAELDSTFSEASVGTYISIHPTADEVELLSRLGISAEACMKVDCYWKHGDDVYFLQVESRYYANRPPGLWARLSAGQPPYVNLVGVVGDRVITHDTLHRVMRAFKEAGVRDMVFGDTLARIH